MSSRGPSGRGVNSASQAPQRNRGPSRCSSPSRRRSAVFPTPASPATSTSRPRELPTTSLEPVTEHRELARPLEQLAAFIGRDACVHAFPSCRSHSISRQDVELGACVGREHRNLTGRQSKRSSATPWPFGTHRADSTYSVVLTRTFIRARHAFRDRAAPSGGDRRRVHALPRRGAGRLEPVGRSERPQRTQTGGEVVAPAPGRDEGQPGRDVTGRLPLDRHAAGPERGFRFWVL